MSSHIQDLSTVYAFDIFEITASWDESVKLDLKTLVSDLDLFEHIDKPWITGLLALEDTSDILAGVGIGGNDRVEIKIRRNEEPDKEVFIHKFFRIDKVVEKINRGLNENSSVVLLHLVEEVWYESNAINVNKSYEGKPQDIISAIAESFLTNRRVFGASTDIQDMKVIVPNMTPLEAIAWIKNRATTNEGFPLFVYSSLPVFGDGTDALWVFDLEYMLKQKPWNEDSPFNNFASSQLGRGVPQRRTILAYEQKKTEDISPLIHMGLIEGRHQFIDVTTMKVEPVDYNHEKDINELLESRGMKGRGVVPSYYSVHGNKLNEMSSAKDNQVGNRLITNIGGTNAYKDALTIDERDKKSQYKHRPLSNAFKSLLAYDPLIAVVDGWDFSLNGHNTIGRVMSFLFMSTQSNPEGSRERFDKQKTGNYLVYAAKHSFKSEGYDVTLTCVKLTHGEYNDS